MKHRSTMYSRLSINFSNRFKCFYDTKIGFPAKTNCYAVVQLFFPLRFMIRTKQTSYITSRIYTSQCMVRVEFWHARRRGFIGELPQVSWRSRYKYYIFAALSQNLPERPCILLKLLSPFLLKILISCQKQEKQFSQEGRYKHFHAS